MQNYDYEIKMKKYRNELGFAELRGVRSCGFAFTGVTG